MPGAARRLMSLLLRMIKPVIVMVELTAEIVIASQTCTVHTHITATGEHHRVFSYGSVFELLIC